MIKFLLAFAMLFSFSYASYADSCTVAMTNGNINVRTYRGTGYGRNEACRDALRECNRDRVSNSRYRYYRCETIRYNPGNGGGYPYPGQESCTYNLQDRYGYTLRTFTGTSYYRSQACADANNQCQSERNYRNIRGEYGLSCFERYY